MTKEARFSNAVAVIELFLMGYKSKYTYEVVESTTNSFKAFKEEIANEGIMYVSNEGCENTIYSSPAYNILARVWHDNVHLKHDYDFGEVGEVKTCQVQLAELRIALDKLGVSPVIVEDALEVIYHDIIGQVEYYATNKSFVANQRDFVFERFLA